MTGLSTAEANKRPLTKDERRSLPVNTGNSDDRFESWVIIAAEPLLVMPLVDGVRKEFKVDAAWLAARVSDYAELTSSGYYEAAHLIEHARAGRRTGDIVKLAVWKDPRDARLKLLAEVRWVESFVTPQDYINSGALRYASPSWVSFTDEYGKQWPLALSEVSAVVAPHQKNLATSHYLGETPDNFEDKTMEEAMKALLASVESIGKRLDAIEENVKANGDAKPEAAKEPKAAEAKKAGKTAPLAEDVPADAAKKEEDKKKEAPLAEDVPAEDDNSEVAALKAQLAALMDAKKRNEFRDFAKKSLGNMSEAVCEAAYKLSEANSGAFNVFSAHVASNIGRTTAPIVTGTDYQWNLGEASTPAAGGSKLSREQCAAKIKASGGKSEDYRTLCIANGHIL